MIGKLVYCSKDKNKILYTVKSEDNQEVTIIGVYYRVVKKCLKSEVYEATDEEVFKERKIFENKKHQIEQLQNRGKRYLVGRILHIDGDEEYLNKCLELYDKMNIYAYGITMKEEKMASEVRKYVVKLNPDIVVITGHDLYNNNVLKYLKNYSNTINFVEAIKEIRKIKGRYECTIIAGACQSNFEALIANGADFASSPKRINIHTFDPAVIAIRVATTSFNKVVNISDISKFIENGKDAFNGIETYGKMRLIL